MLAEGSCGSGLPDRPLPGTQLPPLPGEAPSLPPSEPGPILPDLPSSPAKNILPSLPPDTVERAQVIGRGKGIPAIEDVGYNPHLGTFDCPIVHAPENYRKRISANKFTGGLQKLARPKDYKKHAPDTFLVNMFHTENFKKGVRYMRKIQEKNAEDYEHLETCHDVKPNKLKRKPVRTRELPKELPPGEKDLYSDAEDIIESWQISASNARKAKVRAMQEAKSWLKRVPKMEGIPELPDEPFPKPDMWADFSPLQTARSVRSTTPPEDGQLANLSIDTAGKEWWRRYHLATYMLSPRTGTDHINARTPMSQTCTRGTVQKLEEKRKEKAELKPPAWGCGNGVDPRRKKERKSSALVLPPISSRQALDHGKKNKKKGAPGEEKSGGKGKPRNFKSILRRQAAKAIVEPNPT